MSALPEMVDTDDLLDITLHPYQFRAYNSTKRITALISGIQGGKTRIGGLWMAKQIAIHDGHQQTFIIAGPNFKLMEKSTIPWMLHLLKGCGRFDKGRYRFYLNGGGIIWFASMTDDDSVEGATNVRAIWIDEAGKIRYNSWINLLARSSFKQCPIFITTTPYALNWLYRDIYEPWKRGQSNEDVEIIQFRSIDNPYFPKEEFERQKKNLDPRVFERKYGGTFQKMAGLVYPDFGPENITEPFKIDNDRYTIVAGVDIGFENPFAITVRAIGHGFGHKKDYQVAEFYKSFLGPNEKAEVLRQFQKIYSIETFYVDSAHPDMISLFNTAGLNATPVKKGPDSVDTGIQMHAELIKKRIYMVFEGKCPNTIDEYETYHYAEFNEDSLSEKNPTEKPVPFKDHLMDANRYVTMMTKHLRDSFRDKRPTQKTHMERLIKREFAKTSKSDWYNDA